MLTEYIQKMLHKATYKKLEDGSYFGEIPSAKGVWANQKSLETCREELREVLEDWLLVQIRSGSPIKGLRYGQRIPA